MDTITRMKKMKSEKKAALAKKGWKSTTVKEFLNLTDEENVEIEKKFDLDEMLTRMPEDYQPEEDTWKPVGEEVL